MYLIRSRDLIRILSGKNSSTLTLVPTPNILHINHATQFVFYSKFCSLYGNKIILDALVFPYNTKYN